MINPKLLCRNHLLGEHFEIHCAIGNLKKSGKWAKNLAEKGYLEPQNFKSRHDKLVKEMKIRGYNHNSPLKKCDSNLIAIVDKEKSIKDLCSRCESCKKRINKEYKTYKF